LTLDCHASVSADETAELMAVDVAVEATSTREAGCGAAGSGSRSKVSAVWNSVSPRLASD
jgi:hypothetical protein